MQYLWTKVQKVKYAFRQEIKDGHTGNLEGKLGCKQHVILFSYTLKLVP